MNHIYPKFSDEYEITVSDCVKVHIIKGTISDIMITCKGINIYFSQDKMSDDFYNEREGLVIVKTSDKLSMKVDKSLRTKIKSAITSFLSETNGATALYSDIEVRKELQDILATQRDLLQQKHDFG